MSLGKQILKLRKENKMSQEDFSEIFNVTRQTVSSWENEKSYPDIETLVKISDKFNISLDILIKGDNKMIQDVTKKMKNHKLFKIIIFALIIVLLSSGLIFYFVNAKNREEIAKLNEIQKNMTLTTIRKENLAEDIFINQDNIKYVDILVDNELLISRVRVMQTRDNAGNIVKEDDKVSYIMLELPEEFSYKWDAIKNSNIKFTLVKSTNDKQIINKDLVDKLLNNN